MTTTTIPTLADNPCGRAAALRELRDQIVTGGKPEEVFFSAGNGTTRRVRYGPANMQALNALIAEAESLCSGRPRRFVIGGRP
jgi:hypothetical protein